MLHVGEGNPDIFYTDRSHFRNREYISLGCDELPLFWGRSPVQMYCDFIEAFVDSFSSSFGMSPFTWAVSSLPLGLVNACPQAVCDTVASEMFTKLMAY